MADKIIDVYMVAGGQFHDIDFARRELLALLAEHPRVRTRVASDYVDVKSIAKSACLITYTCNVVPSLEEQSALRSFVEAGGKWLALHGTNSILEFTAKGVRAPETAPVMMETLGSQFIAHPPIQPYRVRITDPGHALVKGIDEFETDDELYLSRIHGDLQVLLHTHYTGKAVGFLESQWDDDAARPVYYLNRLGKGEVLYLTLGHCRGHYDMRPMADYYPTIERGSWERPEFYELLRRAIRHCVSGAD